MPRLVGDDAEEERARWQEERAAELKRVALRGIPAGRWTRLSERTQRLIERALMLLGGLLNRGGRRDPR